jgi:hypothetical protein
MEHIKREHALIDDEGQNQDCVIQGKKAKYPSMGRGVSGRKSVINHRPGA